MYTATFSIPNATQLFAALKAEADDLHTPRAKVTFSLETTTLTISITAKDFPAFRAMESAVMRLLATYSTISEMTKTSGRI